MKRGKRKDKHAEKGSSETIVARSIGGGLRHNAKRPERLEC